MPRSPIAPPLLAGLVLVLLGRAAAAFTAEQAKAPMTATLVRSDAPGCGADCPEWLALTGRITVDTPAVFAAALARLGKRRLPVLLDSPGGESRAGLAMGRMIRARGLDTAVASTALTACGAADRACADRLRAGERAGYIGTPLGADAAPVCASACVFVLAGGVDRSVPYGALVGVHQTKQVLTYHPVVNRFRVLSRVVDGRRIEVSRTLVSTRPLPVRVVTGAAPQSLYSEFDRFLLGLGIDESIMPLMRATPPSGIHWLTPSELTSTRIANDGTPAATLAERAAAVGALAARAPGPPLAAALTLADARRWTGSVRWRVDASVPGAPALVGDWEIPSRHLRGSLSIAPDAARASADAFTVQARVASGPGADAAIVRDVHPPQVCDPSGCLPYTAGPTAFNRPDAGFGVVKLWRRSFLDALYTKDWISTLVRTDEGEGTLTLTLSSLDEGLLLDWERTCCDGFAPGTSRGLPAAGLPAFPDHPEPSLVKGILPVQPAEAGAQTPPRTLGLPALYDAAPMQEHGFPAAVRGSVVWSPPAMPVPARGPAVLIGAADLPAAGLRVSIEVSASRPGVLGQLTAKFGIATDDAAKFGPLARIFALNAYDARGRALLLVDSVGADREVHFDIPETGPIAGAFQVGFEDVRGRRVTLAFPFDPAIAGVLQAASRQTFGAGS